MGKHSAQVSPLSNPSASCCQCEEEDFKKLTSDLFKRTIHCILFFISSSILAVLGIILFCLFFVPQNRDGDKLVYAAISELAAGLLFHLFLTSKSKISKRIRKMFSSFSERRLSPTGSLSSTGSPLHYEFCDQTQVERPTQSNQLKRPTQSNQLKSPAQPNRIRSPTKQSEDDSKEIGPWLSRFDAQVVQKMDNPRHRFSLPCPLISEIETGLAFEATPSDSELNNNSRPFPTAPPMSPPNVQQ